MRKKRIFYFLILIYDKGKLQGGTIAGVTLVITDKIMLTLDSELEFREFELFRPDYIA